jgi:quercetin dioxygenase-like cupin family protein
MAVVVESEYRAGEERALAELERDGFKAEALNYAPGRTEPHAHDYDVCLHVLEGEFRVSEVDRGIVHACGPGSKLTVPAGTRHSEDHGAVRLVVGRRR